MVYVLKDGKAAYIFGIVDHRAGRLGRADPEEVNRAMPLILGTQAPAHSLRDAKLIPELLAKHRFLPTMVAYADMARLFEAVSGHGKGEGDTLDAMLEGKIPAACEDDLSRVASEFPRLSVGYRHFDEQGFSMTVVLDAPASLLKNLMKLHTPMPAMQIKAQPMLAISAAVNVDAMLGWMRDVTSQLRSHPFRCDALATVNHDIDELATKLDEPMPPMFQGLRGFELVVDDATMMPPAGTGHLLVAGDHIADVVRQTFAKIPQLASLQLQPNGVALELRSHSSACPRRSSRRSSRCARLARPSRSATAPPRARASGSPRQGAHAPLFVVSYDLPKLRERFGMFLSMKKDEDGLEGFNVGTTSFALDVGDDGIDLDVMATWAHGR